MTTTLTEGQLTSQINLDTQIFLRLKERDTAAFISLYDTYSPALYGAIIKMVYDETVATQILQQAFLKIWSECATHDYIRSGLFMWMYSVAYKIAKPYIANAGHNPFLSEELIA